MELSRDSNLLHLPERQTMTIELTFLIANLTEFLLCGLSSVDSPTYAWPRHQILKSSTHVFICLSVHLSACLYIYLSICPSIRLSVSPSVCLSLPCLSV